MRKICLLLCMLMCSGFYMTVKAEEKCIDGKHISLSETILQEGTEKVEGEVKYQCSDCSAEFDFRYYCDKSEVRLTSYSGNTDYIWVPEEVNGCKVLYINSNIFENNKDIIGINLPDLLSELPIFSGCEKLERVNIPKSVKKIPRSAFQDCASLSEIVIPESVNEIGAMAFSGCRALEKINIPDSVTGYEVWTYGVFSRYGEQFSNCTNLKQVHLSKNAKGLSVGMFSGCTSLESIDIPEGVEFLGGNVFSDCVNLKQVSLPQSLTKIGAQGVSHTRAQTSTFLNCRSLESIVLPETVEYIGDSTFSGCSSLKSVSGLTMLSPGLFMGCVSLQEAPIPKDTKTIPAGCFMGCTALTKVIIPSGVTHVAFNAFSNCSNLIEILFPDTMIVLSGQMSGCEKLTEIVIPIGLDSIVENEFIGNTNLKKISFENPNIVLNSFMFGKEFSMVKGQYVPVVPKQCIICGYKDSTAERFAKENGLDFEVMKDNTSIKLDFSGFWKYFENGNWISDKYSLVDYDGSKFLVANGVVATNIHGLANNPGTDEWYFLANGQAQTQFSGLTTYDNAWFYVEAGKLNTSYAGFVDYDGGKFYVCEGRIMTEVSGLAQNPGTSDWYYLAGGQAQLQYTGLAYYNKEWFYVVNGKLANDYSGTLWYNGSVFTVENGQVK